MKPTKTNLDSIPERELPAGYSAGWKPLFEATEPPPLYYEEKMLQIHADPILPDDVDEHGNLPHLRCGWSKCGMVFDTRNDLMDHLKKYVPSRNWIDRFHVNCKNVLESNPEMTLEEFITGVKDCYDGKTQSYLNRDELIAYYQHFDQIFKRHHKIKDELKLPSCQKEKAEILFNFRIQSQKRMLGENV